MLRNLFITLSLGCTLFISSCSNANKNGIPDIRKEDQVTGAADEQAAIQTAYKKATDALKKDPEDLQQYLTLASAFISEGRITGNNTYYNGAALQMLDKVTDKTTGNKDLIFQSLSLRSTILLNMHQFKDALQVAQNAAAMNSYNAGIFGALVDANVEMGNYDEAVKDCDKMMSIRPDLRSYSRASYLRQIYGQNAGAIEAMKMAVDAGLPGQENTEWARTTLGDLYFNTGNLDSASIIYRSSLVYRPDYPFALMGLARVEKTRKNYDKALEYAKKAIQVRSESAFIMQMADIYEAKGDIANAKQVRSDVIDLLKKAQEEEPANATIKHNANRELAMAYLSASQPDKALIYAQKDDNMRPNNIDANELMAWTYYNLHDYPHAKAYAGKLFLTHTQNAVTLYKAAMIYTAAGDPTNGKAMAQQAQTINPFIYQVMNNDAKSMVASK